MDLSTVRVPAANTICIVIALLISFLVPIALIIIWSKKSGAKISKALWGAATFLVFALVLERILHGIVLAVVGQDTANSLPFYCIYGGLAAGIFEECGRYIVMRFVMKGNLDKKGSIMFGIGHGGIECIVLIGLAYISNLMVVGVLDSGNGNIILEGIDESLKAATYEQISVLWTTPAWMFLVTVIERLFAIAMHICLSYMVYRALKTNRLEFLGIAIFIHAAMDGVSVAINGLVGSYAAEAFIAVFTIALAVYTFKTYQADKEEAPSLNMQSKISDIA